MKWNELNAKLNKGSLILNGGEARRGRSHTVPIPAALCRPNRKKPVLLLPQQEEGRCSFSPAKAQPMRDGHNSATAFWIPFPPMEFLFVTAPPHSPLSFITEWSSPWPSGLAYDFVVNLHFLNCNSLLFPNSPFYWWNRSFIFMVNKSDWDAKKRTIGESKADLSQ